MASWLGFPLQDRKGWKETFVEQDARKAQVILGARIALAVFWFGITLYSFLDTGKKELWLIHVTIWSALLLLVYLVLSAYATYMAMYSSLPDGKGPLVPWFATLTWALGTMVPAQCTLVALLFWVFVFPNKPPGSLRALPFMTHGVNLVVAVLDLAISYRPFHMSHVYIGFLFNLAYAIFGIIYYACGGMNAKDSTKPYIYKFINWSNPTPTAIKVLVLLFVVIPFVHGLFFLLWQCRRKRCPLDGKPVDDSDGDSLLTE